jgi:hypothetical protein
MYFTENEDEGTVQEGAETGPNTFTQQEVDEIVEQEENHEVEVNRRNGEEASTPARPRSLLSKCITFHDFFFILSYTYFAVSVSQSVSQSVRQYVRA